MPRMASGMPGPVSSTEKPTVAAVDAEAPHLDAALAIVRGKRVLAVDQEIGRDLGDVVGVGQHRQRAVGEIGVDADAAGARAIGGHFERGADARR